ncbi:unnamed protein product [Mytilus coruscus]|uniref:Uncharacterized protein n=1 Tax=Mytilus coruscus TaxID=42192 RepID=A0A6J8AQ74_MYTCO|nr:unnamed protein product [Mytilus coruscus]
MYTLQGNKVSIEGRFDNESKSKVLYNHNMSQMNRFLLVINLSTYALCETLLPGEITIAALFQIQNAVNNECDGISPLSVKSLEAVKWTFRKLNENNYIPGVSIGEITIAALFQIQNAVNNECDGISPLSVKSLEAVKWTFRKLNENNYIPGVSIDDGNGVILCNLVHLQKALKAYWYFLRVFRERELKQYSGSLAFNVESSSEISEFCFHLPTRKISEKCAIVKQTLLNVKKLKVIQVNHATVNITGPCPICI